MEMCLHDVLLHTGRRRRKMRLLYRCIHCDWATLMNESNDKEACLAIIMIVFRSPWISSKICQVVVLSGSTALRDVHKIHNASDECLFVLFTSVYS